MMNEFSFANEMYTVSINGIKDGKASMKIALNKNINMTITAENVEDMLSSVYEKMFDLRFNYYVVQAVKEALRESVAKEEKVDEAV